MIKARLYITIFLIFLMTACVPATSIPEDAESTKLPYLVKIGASSEDMDSFELAEVLVIDAQYYTEDDIAELHSRGFNKIYSYLNVGSVENFRDYYRDFEEITLGDYENWPEERWVDVSNASWQEFIINKGKELFDNGSDGFFVDNTDIYFMYQTGEIYDGLVRILTDLNANSNDIIINGGDVFVTRYLTEHSVDDNDTQIFNAVNQESVYTSYDFDQKQYGLNDEEGRFYLTEYLNLVQSSELTVYVLEYADNADIAKEARKSASKHDYICYVANDIELK